MVGKRAYRRISVNDVDREKLLDCGLEHGAKRVVLGLDIAKLEIVACLRWDQGYFERPWKLSNPSELGVLVDICVQLRSLCSGFSVGVEPTGTYGDAARRALTNAGIAVERISGKAVSDYHEIFDGVPSQHDGKDAAMVAELVSHGRGVAWPYCPLSEAEQILRHQVLRLESFRRQKSQWMGKLEGLLARHWPELSSEIGLSSTTVQRMLATYGSPAKACADAGLAKHLSQQRLAKARVERIVSLAGSTKGLPMTDVECQWVQEIAEESLRCHRIEQQCETKIAAQVKTDPNMQRYRAAVGAATLAVIWSTVGDPIRYGSAGAFLKALGLNLKELSSGKRVGELAISKRGPALTRRWLYFWAVRSIKRKELKNWYLAFTQVGKGRSNSQRKMKGVIALMRKLCKSLWHARVNNKDFDYAQVVGRKSQATRRRRKDNRDAQPSNS